MLMKLRLTIPLLLTFGLCTVVGLPGLARAQEIIAPPEVKPSPLDMAYTKLDDGTYLKVVYHSPRKRGRVIFGGLEPLGKVWRLGANEATELFLTGNISFGGKPLPAGAYSLYAIPDQGEWTIIVNRALGESGAYNYDPSQDVLRVKVPVLATPDIHEAFTITFEEEQGTPHLVMVWDQTKVRVPIKPGNAG